MSETPSPSPMSDPGSASHPAAKRVLVLGGYGMIGAIIARRLLDAGHDVTVLGRSASLARKVLPGVPALSADLARWTTSAHWREALTGNDLVVNCAGALQDGAHDNLAAIHETMVRALASACAERGIALVQISAAGVRAEASTSFFTTKAAGDSAIAASEARWWILRPGLVIAPTAYGGTTLLRMLAAVPLVQPILAPATRMRWIGSDELAEATLACVEGRIAPGSTLDLVSEESRRLDELVAGYRRWLGFSPSALTLTLPGWIGGVIASGADFLGRYGWRSPLRSTAMRITREGVDGNPADWALTGLPPIRSIEATLARHPARVEQRWHARLSLLSPFVLIGLALFWILSGAIGLLQLDAASTILSDAGWPRLLARGAVGFWSLIDIALGLMMIKRDWARAALSGMILVSLLYLGTASVFAPHLWLDPLGPLVKVIPAMLLAMVARVLLEAR
ncbi:MAG: SDR family oxidoreductase [Neomegalonema sp.]|nr:SDR family oxidoreductase [Neomegalonema sp.]